MKVAIESGAYEAILNAANVSDSEIECTIKKYVALLNDIYFIDELWARKALQWCADVMDNYENVTSVSLGDKSNEIVCFNSVENDLEIVQEDEPIIKNGSNGITICEDELVKYNNPQLLCSENQNEQLPNKGWYIQDNNTMMVYTMEQEFETWSQKDERKRKWDVVTKVIINEGISEIKTEYFRDMKNLKDVVFPTTLKKIGFGSFYGCEELKNIKIPNGVEIISARAFEGCVNLENVSIPSSVKYIGDKAFLTDVFWKKGKLNDVYVSDRCLICGGNEHIKHVSV